MSLLPKNEPKKVDITPKNYFIWGQSMSGKTYLARKFPNPIIINTDGNAKKISTPSVEVHDFVTFMQVIDEIENTNHSFETIIIDLIDDVKTMVSNFVCKKYDVEDEGDIGYGKGYREVKVIWQKLMMKLTQLPYNVVFISHVVEITEQNTTYEKPSLEQKYYNMCMGRCDLSIRTRKMGNNFIRLCDGKRENYKESDIQNKTLLNVLKNITGALVKETATTKNSNK